VLIKFKLITLLVQDMEKQRSFHSANKYSQVQMHLPKEKFVKIMFHLGELKRSKINIAFLNFLHKLSSLSYLQNVN